MYNSNISRSSFETPRMAESIGSSQNSDDDFDSTNMMRRDRRRELHTQAEQRRRDAIKDGYDTLLPLIHLSSSTENGSSGSKLSKATILQRTISQIRSLTEQTNQKERELENLKNELVALKIINSKYEEMAKYNVAQHNLSNQQSQQQRSQLQHHQMQHHQQQQQSPLQTQSGSRFDSQVPDAVKFEIFGQFLLALFDSFDDNTTFDDFSSASSTIIHWVEEFCKPQNLNQLAESVLTDVLSQYFSNYESQQPQHQHQQQRPHDSTEMGMSDISRAVIRTVTSGGDGQRVSSYHGVSGCPMDGFPTPARRQTFPDSVAGLPTTNEQPPVAHMQSQSLLVYQSPKTLPNLQPHFSSVLGLDNEDIKPDQASGHPNNGDGLDNSDSEDILAISPTMDLAMFDNLDESNETLMKSLWN